MYADKSLGQHWLVDSGPLQAMLKAGKVDSGDEVLEVGPGLGALTEQLLERGAKVTAVEYDKRLIEGLEKKFSGGSLKLVEGDILHFNLNTLPVAYKVVANIPYYLTSKFLRNLLESKNQPSLIALLVQKEVAERLVAQPGNLSILGVSAQFYAEVELREEVPAKFFDPPPKVDSQIVRLVPRERKLFDIDEKKFFALVKSGFGEKRKKLANSLSGGLGTSKEQTRELIEKCGFSQNIRAQELSLQQWFKLYNKLYN